MWGGAASLTGKYSRAKSKGHEYSHRNLWTDEQRSVANRLGKWLEGTVGKPSPGFTGERVAGLSPQESQGLNLLGQYTSSGVPGLQTRAAEEYTRAMDQNYKPIVDPATSEALYASIRNRVMGVDLPDLQNTIARNANLRGMYFSGVHSGQQHRLLGDVASRLAETLANLKYRDEQARRDIARERERRAYEAAPGAASLGQVMAETPLRQAQAAMMMGSLPRSLEQARRDAAYEEFLRTLPENSRAMELALRYLGLTGEESGYRKFGSRGSAWSVTGRGQASYGM